MDSVRTTVDNHIQPPANHLKRISWGAVVAGVVIAFVVMLTLSLLGLAIGFGAIDPTEEANPFSGLGTGAGIWWGLSTLIALFLGGWVAGRLAGVPKKFEAGIHGALTWGVVMLLSVYFVTSSVGRLISGATGMVAEGVSAMGKGAAALTPDTGSGSSSGTASQNQRNEMVQQVKNEAEQLLRQTNNPELQPENIEREIDQAARTVTSTVEEIATNPGQAGQEINQMIDRLFAQGKETLSSVERDDMANVIAQRTGKSQAEAKAIVDRWANSFEKLESKAETLATNAEAQVRQTGETVASGLSKAALWSFVGILLSGVAGVCGGCVGRPKHTTPVPDEVDDRNATPHQH